MRRHISAVVVDIVIDTVLFSVSVMEEGCSSGKSVI